MSLIPHVCTGCCQVFQHACTHLHVPTLCVLALYCGSGCVWCDCMTGVVSEAQALPVTAEVTLLQSCAAFVALPLCMAAVLPKTVSM